MNAYRLEKENRRMRIYCGVAYAIATLAVGALLASVITL